MATSAAFVVCQDNAINSRQKPREKRPHHHHNSGVSQHIRPMQRPVDNRQRKLRPKQRSSNLISTDGTTSGDDGSETKNKSEQEVSVKLEQLLRPSNQLASDLDLEADCEDNSTTDVDTVSLTGSASNKNELNTREFGQQDKKVSMLHSKILELEKQLSAVLKENAQLKKQMHSK